MPPPLQIDNIFVFIRQVASVPACWLFKTSAKNRTLVEPFDLESGIRVTCDVGYLYANFSLPRPLCSRVRRDVRDRQTDRRQTDVRQKHRLMPPPMGRRHNKQQKTHSKHLCAKREDKTEPGLVAFYDIWSRNEAGLFFQSLSSR